MEAQNCGKCGKKLPQGSLKYILSIKLYADFDGTAHPPEEQGVGNIQEIDNIEYLIRCLESSDQNDIENDVQQEMAFILCKECRDNFSRNPLNKRNDGKGGEMSLNGMLH